MTTPTSKPVKPLNILVAEDNVFHQRLTIGLLEKEGHVVSVVRTGKEAARAVESHDFDLVLMDVEMPEMDGLAATRQIRSEESQRGGHVPIIAFTSVADPARCKAAGADQHLTKPASRGALREAIRHTVMSLA